MDKKVIECQNIESYDQCKTRHYLDSMRKQCACLSFPIKQDQDDRFCITQEQLNCVKSMEVDYSECLKKCEGLDIISYNEYEIYSKLNRFVNFDGNPKLTRYISKLSSQYNNYKGFYNFPTRLTHERLEVKFTNFGRVDHLCPHKAGVVSKL